MARLILSAGMFSALAAATAVRRRGFVSASPPLMRAATVISLISFVKTFPRRASAAPFLCLMVAHLEWPDMGVTSFRSARVISPESQPRGCLMLLQNGITTSNGKSLRHTNHDHGQLT